jgi:signal transduction histidine kinase
MSAPRRVLLEDYRGALSDHLAGVGEAALAHAYELGRRAIAEGLGVLEIAALHHEALQAVVPWPDPVSAAAAQSFFIESLSPFEMAHRGHREANTALRHLSEGLEEEARRIAHALHDEAAQLLATVHVALASLSGELSPPAQRRLAEIRGLLDQVENGVRRLSHELRPTMLDDLGLLPALQFLAEGVAKRTGCAVAVTGSTDGRLPSRVETTLYRIVQEALTNAARDGHAAQIEIRLCREPRAIGCSVADDGVGFNTVTLQAPGGNSGGLGLAGIRERLGPLGGTLDISSTPGAGTRVSVTVPLESEA